MLFLSNIGACRGQISAWQLNARWRTMLVLGSVVLLLGVVGATLWFQDVRYSLPTPRPAGWREVNRGRAVPLPPRLSADHGDPRPILLHFFNPDCPCSKFNAEHLCALRQRFGDRVRFVAVVQVEEAQQIAERDRGLQSAGRLFGPDMEAVVDEDGRLAAACGVYSTPQAVLLSADVDHSLLFRGNYNTTRYCTDPQTEFVRLALEALTANHPLPAPSQAAMVAYGCELPVNVATAHVFAVARPAVK